MKTKKIKIAVACTSNGDWNAVSWGFGQTNNDDENEWRLIAFEGLEPATGIEGLVWVDVEIPLPQSETAIGVAGELEPKKVAELIDEHADRIERREQQLGRA